MISPSLTVVTANHPALTPDQKPTLARSWTPQGPPPRYHERRIGEEGSRRGGNLLSSYCFIIFSTAYGAPCMKIISTKVAHPSRCKHGYRPHDKWNHVIVARWREWFQSSGTARTPRARTGTARTRAHRANGNALINICEAQQDGGARGGTRKGPCASAAGASTRQTGVET